MYDNLILKNRGNLISLQFIHVIQAILLLTGWFFYHILSLALFSITILWIFSGVEISGKISFFTLTQSGAGAQQQKNQKLYLISTLS